MEESSDSASTVIFFYSGRHLLVDNFMLPTSRILCHKMRIGYKVYFIVRIWDNIIIIYTRDSLGPYFQYELPENHVNVDMEDLVL